MLAQGPAKVVALDLNPAQLACLELRVAAYRTLTHDELVLLMGDIPCEQIDLSLLPAFPPPKLARPRIALWGDIRIGLYERCRSLLSDEARRFWDAHPAEIERGIGSAGKFERYFALFRNRVLPLIHSRRRVERLLQGGGTVAEREAFYERTWNNSRWQMLFRIFFGRFVMGRLGRDPAFFQYVQGSVGDRILARTRHALTELDPAENPYLQWILMGRHTTALPYALRQENFEKIRAHLDRLEWRCAPVEAYLGEAGERSIDKFNLSDIFEYMSPEAYETLLRRLVRAGRPGGRLAYWNMLAPRRRPESMASLLHPLEQEADRLHRQDKAFFYSAFILEEVQ
jgi:S-adenosylmethionine-diacylglycerol 3-amino-3-carboxypropyl transferase